MKIRKSEILFIAMVLLSFGVAAYFYPMLPARVASHWSANGTVNGHMSKFWGAFLMPIISAVMVLVFIVALRIDPKRENIQKFREYFDVFVVLLLAFLFYIYGLTLYWNIVGKFNMILWLIPAFAVLFFYVGILISKAEMNWSIGVRTPWTLSSETVWKKTHKITGLLFKIAAVISLAGMIWPKLAIWFLLGPILAVVVFAFVYSFILYSSKK